MAGWSIPQGGVLGVAIADDEPGPTDVSDGLRLPPGLGSVGSQPTRDHAGQRSATRRCLLTCTNPLFDTHRVDALGAWRYFQIKVMSLLLR